MAKNEEKAAEVEVAERPDIRSAVPSHYVVAHRGVGSFREGDVIAAGDLGSAVDVDRLLNLGALVHTDSDDGARLASIRRANDMGLPILGTSAQYAGIPYSEQHMIDNPPSRGERALSPDEQARMNDDLKVQRSQPSYTESKPQPSFEKSSSQG